MWSSSEDSDVPLHSPNVDDWTSFPYSYQPGGPALYSMFHPTLQSALFALFLGSRQVEQRAQAGHEQQASENYPQHVSSQDQQINLASAVRVSIDTAVQSCEVRKSAGMVTRVHELMSMDLLHCWMDASHGCSRSEWWQVVVSSFRR